MMALVHYRQPRITDTRATLDTETVIADLLAHGARNGEPISAENAALFRTLTIHALTYGDGASAPEPRVTFSTPDGQRFTATWCDDDDFPVAYSEDASHAFVTPDGDNVTLDYLDPYIISLAEHIAL